MLASTWKLDKSQSQRFRADPDPGSGGLLFFVPGWPRSELLGKVAIRPKIRLMEQWPFLAPNQHNAYFLQWSSGAGRTPPVFEPTVALSG